MKITSGRVLDRLTAEEQCLGALFTTYTFDPAFFEDRVLRAILRLTSDPVEQADRYHHEARRSLQETPVVVIADASERQPGRRLPFDLLEVSDVVFHPKSVLLIYRDFARLLVGSGNLTTSGYGRNTELFICVDLAYKNEADLVLLKEFDSHLERVQALVRSPGTQLKLFRDILRRNLPRDSVAAGPPRFALLDSTTGSIMDQVQALLPNQAKIESIGMLAPFYEKDDATELDVTSVFGALKDRLTSDAVIDVGISWENPQVDFSGSSDIEEGLGRIWTRSYADNGVRALEHLVPTALGPKTLSFMDQTGQARRCSRDDALKDIEKRRLWMQPPPVAFAPRQTVAAASKSLAEVRLWLHPSTRFVDGRPVHRPLHAKMLVLGCRSGKSRFTLVVMGSPNMSRRALLMRAGSGAGNVELAMAFRLDASVSLQEMVPDLVYVPETAVEVCERKFPDVGPNYALAIEHAIHDPRASTLVVSWAAEAESLPPWQLTYAGKELASSDSPPTSQCTFRDFSLKSATAEVFLRVDGKEYSVPILVSDLVALPATSGVSSPGLEELLMLLARRIGAERAIQVAERRKKDGGEDDLQDMFGRAFGPSDIFKAWWAVAEDIQDAGLSVQGLRLRLEGALGVGAAWACLVDSAAREKITREEVWFYGAELLRELSCVELPAGPDREEKTGVLTRFCDRVRDDMREMSVDAPSRPWVGHVRAFYEEATR